MNHWQGIAVSAVAATLSIVVDRTLLTRSGVVTASPVSDSLAGKVLSVDPPASERISPVRMARVQLASGEIVPAVIGGCVISPGQATRLIKRGSGSQTSYVVAENGR
jgi:hypothetical protein